MVITQRHFLILLMSLILATSLTTAQAGVRLSSTHIKLGQAVILMISGKDIETDFEKVNKPNIRKHFEIYHVEGESDHMRLVLYPRKVGTWQLPAMHQGNIQSDAISVQVDDNPGVKIHWQGPQKSAYFHQLLTWSAKVELSNSANTATMLVHPHANHQVDHQLPKQPTAETNGMLGKTQYWVMGLSSQKKGKIRLRSPVISVKNEGQRPWLFFDEIHWVQVHSLPSYLPRNTAIGQITLQQDNDLPWVMESGQLHHWNLTLKGQNILPKNLPKLVGELATSDEIEWLTPKRSQQILWSQSALLGQVHLSIPYRINHAGFYQLPRIRLTYLDPATDKLQDVYLPSQMGLVVPTWLVHTLKFIASLGLFILIFILWRGLRLIWLKYQLIYTIQQAQNAPQIWQLIEKWQTKILKTATTSGMSLGQWQVKIEFLKVSHETSQLTDELNKMFYQTSSPQAWANLHKTAQAWANSISIYLLLKNELRMTQNFFKAMLKA